MAGGDKVLYLPAGVSKARRGRGRPFNFSGPSLRAEFNDYCLRLLLHAEQHYKKQGVYRFRQEAERAVLNHLEAEGYDVKDIRRSNKLRNLRNRGKKKKRDL